MHSSSVVRQLANFGLVGGVGLVIDLGVFTLLRATVLSPEHMAAGPLLAKVISTSVAICANWLGNRFVTFRASNRRGSVLREAIEFGLISVIGLIIAVACVGVSHYLLGFRSQLADTVSGNGVGLVLGTAFRFVFYRWWVFADDENRLTLSNIYSKMEQWMERRKAREARLASLSNGVQ